MNQVYSKALVKSGCGQNKHGGKASILEVQMLTIAWNSALGQWRHAENVPCRSTFQDANHAAFPLRHLAAVCRLEVRCWTSLAPKVHIIGQD